MEQVAPAHILPGVADMKEARRLNRRAFFYALMELIMDDERDLNYRRGRSGRPLQRFKAQLKLMGTNICWLCGKPINLDLPPNHMWAWTLDHVVPLSMGGEPHSFANAREAHRSCNSARGARPADTVRKPKGSRSW